MKIGFDVSNLCTNRADGLTRYTRELAKRFPSLDPTLQWFYFAPKARPAEASDLPTAPSVRWHPAPWPKYWTQSRLPFSLYKTTPDVLFMPIQQIPYLRPGKMKTVAVIHDLAAHHYPQQTAYKDWLLLHIFSAYVARQANQIIAISQATADDIERFYGRTKNVHVVHLGVDHEQFRVFTGEERESSWQSLTRSYKLKAKNYILYVGQLQPRKNLVRLVEAFEILQRQEPTLQLVIAGSHGWLQKPILERIASSRARENIILAGRVPEHLLPALYNHAQVFVLPSLYEGFGMPIVEAFASGCPVVTANVSSMPEVAGDAAILIDPTSTDSLVQVIQEARRERESLIKRGLARAQHFTWDACAQRTLDIIRSAV
jgi:glycosyltransferase involved in cell wall biosynthesis